MKNKLREDARSLFIESGLTKTEISEQLQVSRRTITLWAHQDNWDTLRMSMRTMPSLVAEKCYHLLHQYTSNILGDRYSSANMNIHQAQIIHLLASTVKKLRNRSTINESMEMFNFFLGGLQRKDANLAAQVAPQIEEYLTCRAAVSANDYLTSDFSDDASIPFPDLEIREQWADEKDAGQISEEFAIFLEQRAAATQQVTEQTVPDPETPAGIVTANDTAPEPPPRTMAHKAEVPLSPDTPTPVVNEVKASLPPAHTVQHTHQPILVVNDVKPPSSADTPPEEESAPVPAAATEFLRQAAARSEMLRRQANEIGAKCKMLASSNALRKTIRDTETLEESSMPYRSGN
jgi:hypothetical protein